MCIKAGSVGDDRAIGNDEHALSQGGGLGAVGEEDDACAAGTKKFAGLGEVLKGGRVFGLDREIADNDQIGTVDQCAKDLELQEVSGTDITCNSIEINAKSRGPSADFTRIDDLSHCGAGNNKVLGQRQGGNQNLVRGNENAAAARWHPHRARVEWAKPGHSKGN